MKPREFRYVPSRASAVDENGESVDKRAHVMGSVGGKHRRHRRRRRRSDRPVDVGTRSGASGQPTPRPGCPGHPDGAGWGWHPTLAQDHHLRRRAPQRLQRRRARPQSRPPRCCPSWPPAPRRARPPAASTSRAGGPGARPRGRSRRRSARARASASARPRTTVTRSSPRSPTTSSRNVVRRRSGSTRVTVTSGRAMASTSPGRPAPDPMSHTRAPAGTTSASTAQLSRCRSHSRGTSRGPSRPRTVPGIGQPVGVRLGQGQPARKRTPPAPPRARGVLFHVKPWMSLASGRVDHHEPTRLHALGLRDQARRGHGVVDDLPLERGHRVERHRLTRCAHLGDPFLRQRLQRLTP